MDYEKQVNKVIAYIGEHLDQELKLDNLCKVACFSKYHFHRLFTAYTGITLQNYIKWLRLRRAAYQLVADSEDTILKIALDAGFESHEAFSRAFKKISGQSPKAFREQAKWGVWEHPPHALLNKSQGFLDASIKEIPEIRLAAIEHRGNFLNLSTTWNRLLLWAKAQKLPLKAKEAFGLGSHDPKDVPVEDFSFDLALMIPRNLKLNNQVIERVLPQGRYVTVMHKGSRDTMGKTICDLYRYWFAESQEELAEFPCVFCYHNFDHKVAETELLTEIRLLLR